MTSPVYIWIREVETGVETLYCVLESCRLHAVLQPYLTPTRCFYLPEYIFHVVLCGLQYTQRHEASFSVHSAMTTAFGVKNPRRNGGAVIRGDIYHPTQAHFCLGLYHRTYPMQYEYIPMFHDDPRSVSRTRTPPPDEFLILPSSRFETIPIGEFEDMYPLSEEHRSIYVSPAIKSS